MRAEQHSDCEVADDRWQAQAPKEGDHQDGGCQQRQKLRQDRTDGPMFGHEDKLTHPTKSEQSC